MRISIPEEIEKSSRILSSRDRILAQANEEGARVVQLARKKGEEMLDQEVSVQAAHNRAANIIEQARLEAENIIADADKYVLDELARLEQHLIKTLTVVRNGMVELTNNHAAAQAARSEAAQQAAVTPMPAQPPVQMPRPEMQFAPREQVEINSDNS
jgi:hypothetical protein